MAVSEWSEIAYLAIAKIDSSDYQFCSITDTIDIALGDKSIESMATLCGGRITKSSPMDNTELTFEIFPIGTDVTSSPPNSMINWFFGVTESSQASIITPGTSSPDLFRVVVLWTDESTVSNAAGLITGNSFRVSFWGSRIISHKMSFTDDLLTATVKFTCPPFNRSAQGMIKAEENATSLAALGDYVTTTNERPT